jgi:hypothetical protein
MVSEKIDCGTEALSEEDKALALDVRMAREIAEFVAERALLFTDVDSRAWALTDFGVWAVLAGRTPTLSLGPVLPPDDVDESVS